VEKKERRMLNESHALGARARYRKGRPNLYISSGEKTKNFELNLTGRSSDCCGIKLVPLTCSGSG